LLGGELIGEKLNSSPVSPVFIRVEQLHKTELYIKWKISVGLVRQPDVIDERSVAIKENCR
jgi:hypothetical protein